MNEASLHTGLSCDFMLFLVFLILKLTGVINWSWWLIFLPIYLVPAILLVVFLVIVILRLVAGLKSRKIK